MESKKRPKRQPLVDQSLAPSEKLVEYMRLHREYTLKRIETKKKLKPIMEELLHIKSELSRIGTAINQLKHGGKTVIVSDHAIVRYLERIEGVDVEEIRRKIWNHSNAVKQGNIIVTVNEDLHADK